MTDAISIWLHVLAVSVWIGPQIFLFAAAIPALRTIEDAETRTRLLRTLVTRFGWLGYGAIAVIIVTGIVNLYQIDGHSVPDLLGNDLRFGRLFWEKMVFVALALTLSALHTFFVGPRQLRLMEAATKDEAAIRSARRLSIALSGGTLLASIAAVYMGAVLTTHDYSLAPR